MILALEWEYNPENLWAASLFKVWSQNSHLTQQQLLKPRLSNKIRAVQKFFSHHWEARSWYNRWIQELAAQRFLDPKILFFTDKARFTLKGNIKS